MRVIEPTAHDDAGAALRCFMLDQCGAETKPLGSDHPATTYTINQAKNLTGDRKLSRRRYFTTFGLRNWRLTIAYLFGELFPATERWAFLIAMLIGLIPIARRAISAAAPARLFRTRC
jgi:hypothetical protein